MTVALEATISESYPVKRTEGSETVGDTHAQVMRRQIRRACAGIGPCWDSDRQHMKQVGRKFRQSVWNLDFVMAN
jgi:hypothetical protein